MGWVLDASERPGYTSASLFADERPFLAQFGAVAPLIDAADLLVTRFAELDREAGD
jgi:hypothetical protein